MGWNEQQACSEVGIVMSLEVSRLSRNDADWYHLVHLCRWTGTLIDGRGEAAWGRGWAGRP